MTDKFNETVCRSYSDAIGQKRFPVTGKQRKDICIVTPELRGIEKSGGIGIAYYNLASLLSTRHNVTVLYCGEITQNVRGQIAALRATVDFEIDLLPDFGMTCGRGELFRPLRAPFFVYKYLSDKAFDIVHFSEYRALGYYTLHARQAMGAFRDTKFFLKVSSGVIHAHEANNQAGISRVNAIHSYMEKYVCEHADILVPPSQYILDWMLGRGYDIPLDRVILEKNYIVLDGSTGRKPVKSPAIPNGIAFMGRVEKRKGIEIFAKAVTQLATSGFLTENGLTVGVFGGVIHGNEFYTDYLKQLASEYGFEFCHYEDLGSVEANEKIDELGLLRVIPSLAENSPMTVYEALIRKQPFIAARSGGIPEQIDPVDHDLTLFDATPEGIVNSVETYFQKAQAIPRASFDMKIVAAETLKFHDIVAIKTTKAATSKAADLSLIVTHYRRPNFLLQLISTLYQQTDQDFELIIVDDGSNTPDSDSYLQSLETLSQSGAKELPKFFSRLKVVRQPNKYLGAARNTGARHATTDNLVFMDDDNLAMPEMIETYKHAAGQKGYDLCVSLHNKFQSNGLANASNHISTHLTHGNMQSISVDMNLFSDAQCLVRRAVFEQIGGFSEARDTPSEDHEFFLKASLSKKEIRIIPEPLYEYRVQPGQMSDDKDFMYLGKTRVMNAYSATCANYEDIVRTRFLNQFLVRRPTTEAMSTLPKISDLPKLKKLILDGWFACGNIILSVDFGFDAKDWQVQIITSSGQSKTVPLVISEKGPPLMFGSSSNPSPLAGYQSVVAPIRIGGTDVVKMVLKSRDNGVAPYKIAVDGGGIIDGAIDFVDVDTGIIRGWATIKNPETEHSGPAKRVLLQVQEKAWFIGEVDQSRRDIAALYGVETAGFIIQAAGQFVANDIPKMSCYPAGSNQALRLGRAMRKKYLGAL